MTIRVHALEDQPHVLTPLRLTRAVSGRPRLDAPDPDDRGWEMPRPPGWVETEARGAMIGITVGDTIRLRVVREDFPPGTSLFVTASSGGAPQFKIAEPEGGGVLPPDGVFRVEALEDNDTPQSIEIRLGSVTGPILAEAEPHVFEQRTLRVVPHVCTIHSGRMPVSGSRPKVDLQRWFSEANSILRPAGIRLRVDSKTRQSYTSFGAKDVARYRSKNEMATLVGQGWVAKRCNVYFVRYLENMLGIGVNRGNMSSVGFPNPAVVLAVDGQWSTGSVNYTRSAATRDQVIANDIAHEVGHFLTLIHAGGKNSPGFPDAYHRRNLMHPANPDLGAEDVGYGPAMRGALVTLKTFATVKGDGQVAQMRDRLRQPSETKY